ncbi:unnamed protein product [Spirodela intermedia]|uniref:Uncharacterized protein n=1 Tax=Spirodela intermedia TaxID=51605 RepID=A0A7I8IDJ3_SPIIN|nr:unnamed protein product [Spirodela intermedia]CAA6655465.1 unnamed protein product [Spirodela intermedia]
MDASDPSHSRVKRDVEESLEGRDSRVEEDEEWNGSDKRKHRSSNKLRQHSSSTVEAEERETGKRKSSGERNDGRRKSGVSSRADSGDDEDYDVRRESRSKVPKKNQEDRSEKRSGDGYRERESESSRKVRGEDNEKSSSRKTSVKSSGHESAQSRSRTKADGSHESELEKVQTKDSRYTERKESHRDKSHSSRDQEKSHSRRKWDENDLGRKAEDGSYADRSDSRGGKASDHNKQGSSKERADSRNDLGDAKSGLLDSVVDRSDRSGNADERRVDGDSNKGRPEVKDDESRSARDTRNRDRSVEDIEPSSHRTSSRSQGEKSDKHKQHRDIREKSVNVDDDGYGRSRDRSVRESRERRHSKRSHSPERKHYKESDDADRGLSESDNEKNLNTRDRDGYRDSRSSKGKDGYRDDRNRDREVSKDHWRRSHATRQDRENKDRDAELDYDKDWDGDKYHSRSTHRKDSRGRNEATKASSGFGNVNDHSDTIEIRPNKNLDFGRESSVSTFKGGDLKEADEEWAYTAENRSKASFGQGDDPQERYGDDGSPMDQNYSRNSFDTQGSKGRAQKSIMNSNRTGVVQIVGNGSQPPFGNNQGSSSINRSVQQGAKMGRSMRGGRGRLPGRDVQRGGIQLPMLGPPFGHLGLPPGAMPPIGPNMISSCCWQGGRGIDMNMLGVPPALSPLPTGPSGPRFPPGMAAGPNHGMYFNQPGPGRGVPLNTPNPEFTAIGAVSRGMPHDKAPGGWTPSRMSGPPGKAPSRGEQNDYSQNFVDTGMRPQNFIRELELTTDSEKDEIVAKSATPPMYYKCDLREFALSPEFFGTKFDVILVDPPWEEYVHRAPGVADHMESWTFEEIQNLKIEAIADTPSFIFLWVGDGVGLEQGRQCLKKWGFRRCEDICWVKTNKTNAAPSLRHDSHTLFQHSKEHCLMGIKGTVRRSTDGHIIHANIDTDVIIAEEPPYGSTTKPEDLYRIVEHFSLGRRRVELFGEDHNIRSGWLTLGKELSSSNFNKEAYCKNFADKDGKVWQGGGGRNPPLDAPHLVVTTPDIESLRPKSPPQKNQQQQSTSLSTTASSSKRTTGNSPQNPPLAPPAWTPPMGSFKAAAAAVVVPTEAASTVGGGAADEKFFDGYPPPSQRLLYNQPEMLLSLTHRPPQFVE